MNGGAAGGPAAEAHMLIGGQVLWAGGYMLRCRTCGATADWRLSAYPGGDADMTCAEGHVQRHPLVYPEMVLAASAAGRDGSVPQEVSAALDAIEWRPHARIIRDGTIIWQPWEQGRPAYWAALWPDLCQAAQGGLFLGGPPRLGDPGERP